MSSLDNRMREGEKLYTIYLLKMAGSTVNWSLLPHLVENIPNLITHFMRVTNVFILYSMLCVKVISQHIDQEQEVGACTDPSRDARTAHWTSFDTRYKWASDHLQCQ